MAQYSEAGGLATIAPPLAYAVVIEWAETNYSAYVPDLPGCIATGDTVEEVLQLIREGIAFHLAGMIEDGEPIPASRTRAAMVEVAPIAQSGAA